MIEFRQHGLNNFIKKAETRHVKRLTPMQLEMIQRNRLIGEIELIEQDERVKQAGKKK